MNCTGCAYCMPCPQGINIPGWFERYNNASMYEALEDFRRSYNRAKESLGDSAACISCGKCENVCPQSLAIRDYLKEIEKKFQLA